METSAIPRKHFNLYYFFLEDKRENTLSEERAEQIRQNVLRRINELKEEVDSS